MKRLHVPGIGMRTVKTAIAVMLCLALGRLVGGPAPIYACFAAVLTVRETVGNSIQYRVTRVLATLFGGAVGLLVLALSFRALNPWLQIPVIGLAVIVTIHLTIVVKRPDTAALAALVCLIIVLDHADDQYAYALQRIVETVIGVALAVCVNVAIKPGKIAGSAQAEESVESDG
jgi:uncharacterized membrane protein YgaE (UPF0421/DUF939 family)